jgi:hypothetical protein
LVQSKAQLNLLQMEAASFVVGKAQGVEAADVRAPLLCIGLLHQKKSSCCCVAVVPSAGSGSASRVFFWRAHARPPKRQGFGLRALSKNKHGPQGSVQQSVLHWRGAPAESPYNKRVLQILLFWDHCTRWDKETNAHLTCLGCAMLNRRRRRSSMGTKRTGLRR